ncbi:unnamed protein product [Phytomonas sp. EM1]|nr:unnamed protein product [Phytomonas sp. EM1]|eukprot:CCW61869.1 unnamed protein product [Phytomonas sp. isolate EM1]
MLRLSRLLCSSSTGRTVGRAAGAALRRRRADPAEGRGKPQEIVLPWCARPTYDIHTNEWKYLDRMLAGVIGMTDQEVSERSLRLVGRDLLCEVEEPVVRLRRERLLRSKRNRPGQSAVFLSGESESAMAGGPRGHRSARKDATIPSQASERVSGEDRARERGEEKSAKAGSAPSSPPSSGVRIRAARAKLADAEESPRKDPKSPLPLASLLRSDVKKVPGVVPPLRLRAHASAISHGNAECIRSISRSETAAPLELEGNKSPPKKAAPHSGLGTRKRMPSRKVKDKSEISVHLV